MTGNIDRDVYTADVFRMERFLKKMLTTIFLVARRPSASNSDTLKTWRVDGNLFNAPYREKYRISLFRRVYRSERDTYNSC